MQPTIKFMHNWNNKLLCGLFTTIRSTTGDKYHYYRKLVGEKFSVELKSQEVGTAKLIYVKEETFSEVHPLLLMLDTGYKSMTDVKKLFGRFGIKPESRVLILTFENTTQEGKV